MSRSPCYSPVLEIMDPNRNSLLNNETEGLNLQNASDSNDPVTHPFNYAQDAESWYAEVAAAAHEEYRNQRAEKQTSKKRKIKSKSLKTTSKSFIMRKESDRVQRIIKITIHDLDGGNLDEISSDDASVNVQYLVTSEYDDIMTETDYLVSKIVKKLSK